jgi:hypothetical protein
VAPPDGSCFAASKLKAKRAAAAHGIVSNNPAAISNSVRRLGESLVVFSNDMIRTSKMSDSLIPMVVSGDSGRQMGADPIRRTSDRAYTSGLISLAATVSSQQSSRVCLILRRAKAAAG